GCPPGARMGRCGENDLGHAAEEVLGLFASVFLLLQIEQNLFYDEPAETVADENDGPRLEARLAQQDFEDINRPVLQRHGGPEPIGCRSLVSQGIDRNSIDVLGQPERPKRDILPRFCAPSLSAPSIIGMAAEAMDKNHAPSRRAVPPNNLYQ